MMTGGRPARRSRRRSSPPPSSSVGTPLIAADRITVAKPAWIQIMITINQ